ncbi:hypothetical protein P692DRAFT_20881681 [Suillus brevipes Sb2]|nr:hypothetical protein P692DRAFT_20881681 [Suillus brevipes Sb2]
MSNLLSESASKTPVLDHTQRQVLIAAAQAKYGPEIVAPIVQRIFPTLSDPDTVRALLQRFGILDANPPQDAQLVEITSNLARLAAEGTTLCDVGALVRALSSFVRVSLTSLASRQEYLALQCQNQHNTQFFSDCCHPLAANESASALPSQCQMPTGVSCSNGVLVSVGSTDDGCDEPSSTPTASAPTSSSSSAAVKSTPAYTLSSTTEKSTPTPTPSSSSIPVNVAPTPTTSHTSTHTSSATGVSTTTPSTGSSDSSLNYGTL